MILLKKLNLDNFLSHGSTEINFDENSKVLFDGNSGAGKSAIFEAIVWTLYGEGRSSNASLVRSGNKKATVTLELEEGEEGSENKNIVTLKRSVTSAGKHTLEVIINNVAHPLTGVRDLQAWIEKDLIGASYLLFINSVAYLQGNTESFVSQNAPKRKEILLEIVKADDYDKFYDKANKELSLLETKRAVVDKQKEIILSTITALQEKIDKKNHYLDVIKSGEEKINVKLTEKSAIQSKIKEIHDNEGKIHGLQIKLKDAEATEKDLLNKLHDINKTKDELELVKKRISEFPDITGQILQLEGALSTIKDRFSVDAVKTEARNKMLVEKPSVNKARLLSDIAALDGQLHRAHETFKDSPSCPAGDTCPYVGKLKENESFISKQHDEKVKLLMDEELATAEWEKEYDKNFPVTAEQPVTYMEISIAESSLRNKKTEHENQVADLGLLVKLVNETKDSSDIEKSYGMAQGVILLIKNQIGLIGAPDLSALASLESNIFAAEKELDLLRFNVAEAKTMLSVIMENEKRLEEEQKKLVSLKGDAQEIELRVEKLLLVKDAFGSRGIKTVVIDYILPKLENKINNILHQLSDFTVRLDTQIEKADGEGNKEGLFITIINEMGQELPFEAYSGGERLRITVAITEALASLQKVGFRLFDETFLSLDSESLESFMAVLDQLLARFRQTLLISHIQEIKDMFNDVITIGKSDGISVISRSLDK